MPNSHTPTDWHKIKGEPCPCCEKQVKLIKELVDSAITQTRNEDIRIAEKNKMSVAYSLPHTFFMEGYNRALSDFITTLQAKNNEV